MKKNLTPNFRHRTFRSIKKNHNFLAPIFLRDSIAKQFIKIKD